MAKAELKTRPHGASVKALLDAVADPRARTDCQALSRLMCKVTGRVPKMWGSST